MLFSMISKRLFRNILSLLLLTVDTYTVSIQVAFTTKEENIVNQKANRIIFYIDGISLLKTAIHNMGL